MSVKSRIFSNPSVLTFVLGAQKNRDGSFEYPQHMFRRRNKVFFKKMKQLII